jgi:hypothetical protein
MVVRQARLTAQLLLATIVALAAWSLLHFGPEYPLTPHSPGGAPQPVWRAALLYPAWGLLWTLVCEAAARARRWRRNVVRAGNVLATAWVGTTTLILAAQATLLARALGWEIDRSAALAAVIGVILLYRANLLPKSRPAWFNGVALPVFAGNSDVWRRVHRASAVRLAVIALAALALAIFRPAGVDPLTTTGWLLAAELIIASGHGLWLGRALRS